MKAIRDEDLVVLTRVRNTIEYYAIKYLIHGVDALQAHREMEQVFANLIDLDELGLVVEPELLTSGHDNANLVS